MIAAPRLATVGMKVSASHSWSPTASAAFRPPTSAWKMSGYWVAEWLPQIVILRDLGDRHAELGGELRRSRGCGRAGSAPRSARWGCRGRCSSR